MLHLDATNALSTVVANMFKRVLWDLSEDTEPILYIYIYECK